MARGFTQLSAELIALDAWDESRGAVLYGAVSVGNDGSRTTFAQSGSGDLYAGHDGNVYRKTEDGWQQHGDGGWTDVDVPERPGDGTRPAAGEGGFSREQFDAASRDAARDSAGATGSRIQDVGVGTGEQRYGGSGSLESRAGTATRPATTNYNQLNRDAAARNGSYQNYQRRTSTRSTGMSRGMRPRRR